MLCSVAKNYSAAVFPDGKCLVEKDKSMVIFRMFWLKLVAKVWSVRELTKTCDGKEIGSQFASKVIAAAKVAAE